MRSALFDSAWGPLAVGLAVGCLMLVATLVALARPRGAWLRSRLEPYGGAVTGTGGSPAGATWRPHVERLHRATDRALRRTSLWARLGRQLERANLHTSPATVVLWSALAGSGLATVLALVGRSPLLAVIGCGVGAFAPFAVVASKGAQRKRAFEAQLPDVLMTISGSLKVGQSFNHSLRATVEEGQPPASEEFARVLNEARLGRPMDDALESMADRIDSEDLRFVLMSVTIQREIGGSLAELFQTVSDAVRDRQQFRRRVKAVTAMGRASAYVLLALPFFTAGLIALVNPDYLKPLADTGVGQAIVATGLAMMVGAALILKKIVTIKG